MSWKFTFCCAPRFRNIKNLELEKKDIEQMRRNSTLMDIGHSDTLADSYQEDLLRNNNIVRAEDIDALQIGVVRQKKKNDANYKDYDVTEYADAQLEEAEDHLRGTYLKEKRKMEISEIQSLTGSVAVDQVNMSLLMQVAVNPEEVIQMKANKLNDTSMLMTSLFMNNRQSGRGAAAGGIDRRRFQFGGLRRDSFNDTAIISERD